MERKLNKPQFVKLATLQSMRDGYNVYVKVVSVDKSVSQNGNYEVAKAIVADDSGCADAFFKEEDAKLINKDDVIAIRNGRVRLIKGHICLEIDIFGRLTPENIEIKPNTTNNISEKEFNRKPRNGRFNNYKNENFNRNNRQPFKEKRDERFNREDKERKPRENYDRNTKPKVQWCKIAGIQPGEQDLNITAKVISVDRLKNKARVVLGDQTGVVKAFLPNNDNLKVGNTIVLFHCEATVVKEHIEIQLMDSGRLNMARNRTIEEVEEGVNISEKAWVESA